MKICIVLDSLIRAGAERQAVLAIEELARQGRDATLVYYNTATYAYVPSVAARARIVHLPKKGHKLRFLWRLFRFFKQGHYDVVHGFLGGTSIYVAIAGCLAGVPVVFGGIRAEYDCTGIIRLFHRVVNKIVTGWIVNSQATVRSMGPGVGATVDRVYVVYNGIDPIQFSSTLSSEEAKRRLSIAPDAPVVTLVARLSHQKNIPLFLEIAQRVHNSKPGVQFLIAGDGELRDDMQRLARDKGLSEAVRFLGNRPDIPDVLRATDVMTLTSHYEGLSNTLLEAMSVGVPIISTAYAGVEELFSDAVEGFVVPLGDAESFVRRLFELLDDPSMRQRMGNAGRQRVMEHFTIHAMGKRLYEVYESAYRNAVRSCS